MTIDAERLAAALSSPDHPTSELAPIVRRYLDDRCEDEYRDFLRFEAAREALSMLDAGERRRRALELASCWDGVADPTRTDRFARIGFAQGISYHHVEGEPALLGPSFAPISWYDVHGLAEMIAYAGGNGADLAACVDYAAFDGDSAKPLELFRDAFRKKPEHHAIRLSLGSLPDVNDRLFRLLLAPLGDEPTLRAFVEHAMPMQSMGAQDPSQLEPAIRWLDARGIAPIARPIDLRIPDEWDGGHRSGGNSVQAFLARIWSADLALVEEAAAALFARMWAPPVVAAICASLPFEQTEALEDRDQYRRLFRQGRLVVTHAGKKNKDGRITVKLHADAKKAQKDAEKKLAKMRTEIAAG